MTNTERVSVSNVQLDDAIRAAGFGLFNFVLLIKSIMTTFASMYETSTMSHILPNAECDLRLTSFHKGALNGAAYGGMIFSSIFWGFLADTHGRKFVMLIGLAADTICVIGSALSQNFWMLIVFKVLGGVFICGAGPALLPYLAEFHSTDHRPLVVTVAGINSSAALIVLTLKAWSIIPQQWQYLYEEFKIYSWHIFLAVSALPGLIAVLVLLTLPESPIFLIAQGRNEEAIAAFKQMYRVNTRKDKDTYPVELLGIDAANQSDRPQYTLREHLSKFKVLFQKPLLRLTAIVYTMQFTLFLGYNTIRLWMPQLFATITLFTLEQKSTNFGNICPVLEHIIKKAKAAANKVDSFDYCDEFIPAPINTYTNTVIVSSVNMLGFVLASVLTKLIKLHIMLMSTIFASICFVLALFWMSNITTAVALTATFQTVSSMAIMTTHSIVIELLPANLRTIVLCCSLMAGRFGALIGNLLFPTFAEIWCMLPFLAICALYLSALVLSFLLTKSMRAQAAE